MNAVHRRLGTYTKRVDAHIALAEFSKAILVRSGLPQDRVFVKPNFVPAQWEPGEYRKPQLIFVGRISREKGIHLLLQAWSLARNTGRISSENSLVVIGEGPDRVCLEQQFGAGSGIVWLGTQPNERVMDAIATSRLLSLPSLCYENCPMVLLEAFSVGTPVIAPDHGPLPEMVSHDTNGLLFPWGDVSSLAAALSAGMNASSAVWSAWSRNARSKYLAEYTEKLSYERLLKIYRQAVRHFKLAHSEVCCS
jgi:glycosyltransferase involved in cell wall biosynthesis